MRRIYRWHCYKIKLKCKDLPHLILKVLTLDLTSELRPVKKYEVLVIKVIMIRTYKSKDSLTPNDLKYNLNCAHSFLTERSWATTLQQNIIIAPFIRNLIKFFSFYLQL